MSIADLKKTQNPVIATRTAATAAKPTDAKTAAAKPAAPKPTAQTPAAVVSLNRSPAPALPTYTAAGTKTPTAAATSQLSAASKVQAPTTEAATAANPAAGGGLTSSGDGHVVVDIMGSDSGYQNKIYWSADNWATRNYLGVDNNTGSYDLGSFAKGTKIQFGIDNGQGDFFKTGAASGNADNYEHARVTSDASGTTVGFEDLRGGGDQDFNDAIVRVRGVSNAETAAAPTAPAKPEPVVVQAPKPVSPAPVQAPVPAPQKPVTKDNRSGLGDGTNPGQGAGRVNSPNTGTKNPNQSTKTVTSAQQTADARLAIVDTVKKPQPTTVKNAAAAVRKA